MAPTVTALWNGIIALLKGRKNRSESGHVAHLLQALILVAKHVIVLTS